MLHSNQLLKGVIIGVYDGRNEMKRVKDQALDVIRIMMALGWQYTLVVAQNIWKFGYNF